jgi:hypothetical protein
VIPGESCATTIVVGVLLFCGAMTLDAQDLRVGMTGRDGGEVFTLRHVALVSSLPRKVSYVLGDKPLLPRPRAKLVVAYVDFLNDRKASVDIYCAFHLGSALYDSDGRRFDHVPSLYEIVGNTGCNERIQPGFGSSEAIAFEIPEGATPVTVVFWDPQEADDALGKISVVRFTLVAADFNRTSPK